MSAKPSTRRSFLVVLTVLGAVAWQGAAASPPLIDREVFFGDPEIAGAQISPDGRWISFRKPHRDVMNIWVKRTREPFDAARPLTADTERPIRGYFWTEDSRFILYIQDKGGNEDFHVYAVNPEGAAAGETGVPESRDLTPIEGVRAYIYAVPEANPNEIIIGLNDRDPALHDVYRLSIDTGERELLIKNHENVGQWITDLQGNIRLAWRQTQDGGSEILRVENGRLGKAIYTCSFEESCFPARFHKDGRQVYLTSNKGEDVDLIRLMLLDPTDGSTTLVESDPEGEVDFGSPIFSDKTEELIGTSYVGDRQRIYPRTAQLKKDLDFLRAALPDGELSIGAQTEDERLWIVSVSSDVNPGQVYLYDRSQRRVEKLYDARPGLPTEHLARMRPVRYRARDGQEIPAYLTTPKAAASNLPTVIVPHGGPWSRDTWGYDSLTQFLANRGYAVFQPNFRGSTGYGKAFLNAGNNEWGTGVMQHDLTDAVAYLVDQGIADPKRVAILGGSYGGYATLAGVTFTPQLYAAGVSIVGPSNIITLLDSIPPYWGPIKKIFDTRVGDPDDPADRRRLQEQSPFYHARRITAPLLVIQGANDPRVKKAESDQIVVALRDLQREVEYLVAPDEGHGFAGEENRLAMFAVIEEFLAEHLGGRYQRGASSEVADRIAALTVDVSTVEMPLVHQKSELAATAPLPVPDASLVAPVTLTYRSRIELPGGREMIFDGTKSIARDELEGESVWRVEVTLTMPMGQATDVFMLDATSLRPIRRTVKQGPISVELAYGDTRITGTMSLPGQEIPIDVKLEAPVFGGDAALEAVLGALPLTWGYQTTLRTFDVQTQKVRTWLFEVTDRETLETEAGSFDCFKTQLTALDGEGGDGTLWFTTEPSRVIVRSEVSLPPAMGGGQMIQELISKG